MSCISILFYFFTLRRGLEKLPSLALNFHRRVHQTQFTLTFLIFCSLMGPLGMQLHMGWDFWLFVYPLHLKQCLACGGCLPNICSVHGWMNKWLHILSINCNPPTYTPCLDLCPELQPGPTAYLLSLLRCAENISNFQQSANQNAKHPSKCFDFLPKCGLILAPQVNS